MSGTKISLVSFPLKLKISYSLSRGLNVSVVNYQNPGKTQEKNKTHFWTLHYRHYITEITLGTLHYGHYDCMNLIMVILLGKINATGNTILFKFITSKFAVLLTKH